MHLEYGATTLGMKATGTGRAVEDAALIRHKTSGRQIAVIAAGERDHDLEFVASTSAGHEPKHRAATRAACTCTALHDLEM